MSDIKYEPPVGSQVTDFMGDVWERRKEGWSLWWPERSGWLADLYGDVGPWRDVRDQAPLRSTTDEDRERVGLPVTCCGKCPPVAGGGYDCTCEGNPSCEKVDTPEEWHNDPAPDEALAEAEGRIADLECRAKRAESELADMTRQRDALGRMADHNHDVAAKVKADRDEWCEDAIRNGEDRNKWMTKYAEMRRERDEWKARYKALRADVEYFQYRHREYPGTWELVDALARDTQRGE